MCCCLNIPSVLENNGAKVMKELPVEDEEEERFQADLKMAVRQSLGRASLAA
ncbi:inactive ubiquitin carboxyl-terminal hydrolase 54 [Trifolium medium]|uniref:Inactive ubiquitin carboxyl-terminal hydrolase 54 n=1 Tax=Trifolium medium TaxID=97028 RepID=A0A392MKN2_9FABA|nr:inactive ubiquitin carboxyl-terminal hydrolase 54 [Trifolium medium]